MGFFIFLFFQRPGMSTKKNKKNKDFEIAISSEEKKVHIETNKCKVSYENLRHIKPITETQKSFFKNYDSGAKTFLLHGVAGTGKTFIALYKALEEVLRNRQQQKVVIIRSAVPSRDIGHLPGDEKEKSEIYQIPYIDICERLINHSQSFSRLQEQKSLEFLITSFVRGITLDNAIIIVDECQNMTDMEINSIMTRIGNNSKIIFCGDFRQTDLNKKNDMSGLQEFIQTIKLMPSFHILEFGIDDIVRSEIVKSYIIARLTYADQH
jgi:phosphate starvation-inducible PhoH-like protein